MNIAFNPKDSNQFASACLDRTVKVWSLGSNTANFTLEAHDKGVNYVEYYHGGEKPYLITCGDDRCVRITRPTIHQSLTLSHLADSSRSGITIQNHASRSSKATPPMSHSLFSTHPYLSSFLDPKTAPSRSGIRLHTDLRTPSTTGSSDAGVLHTARKATMLVSVLTRVPSLSRYCSYSQSS
jgi:WD40 repeat protein